MKRIFLVFGFALIATSGMAQSTAKIKAAAQQMVNAMLKGDYTVAIDYTYPKLIKQGGGRQVMIDQVKKSFSAMKANGITMTSAGIGEPGKIQLLGKRQFSIVPESITMTNAQGSFSAKSNMLAVTEDAGTHWYFINAGTMSDDVIYGLFPEIKGKIVIPKQEKPVFTPAKK